MLVTLATLVGTGCAKKKRGGAGTSAADSVFVQTIVELRKVATDESLDSARRVAERGRVLQRRGLTPATLEARSRELAKTPAHATAVWDAIGRATNGGVP
jgi:hypothetical protein